MIPIVERAPSHNDAEIADLARHLSVSQLRSTLRRYPFPDLAPVKTGEPAFDADSGSMSRQVHRAAAAARCNGRWTEEGRYQLVYDAPADEGALVQQALAEAKDALFQTGEADVTLATAFIALVTTSMNRLKTDGPAGRADKYRIYVHLDTAGGWLNKGPALPSELFNKLTCNGVVQPVWETGGHAVSVGRTRRIVPDRTRRLVEDRDRGCRFPGCNSTGYVEVHHIRHWTNGGPTDTGNLVCLCPYHHDSHHRAEYAIGGNPDQPAGPVFTDSDGRMIGSRTPTPPTGPPPHPPDGKGYRHPLGERVVMRWIWFRSPPASERDLN